MIVYITDRYETVLSIASTSLPEGIRILDDMMTDEIESGIKTFEIVLSAKDESIRDHAIAGNYILADGTMFIILTDTFDSAGKTVSLYCEDAGLDFINRTCGKVTKTAKTFEEWITNILGSSSSSGWTYNFQIDKTKSKTLEYTSESTATERLLNILDSYDAEMYFTYIIDGLKVSERIINFTKKRGGDEGLRLYINREVKSITRTNSIEKLATVWKVYGKDNKPLSSLSGYDDAVKQYNKGDVIGKTTLKHSYKVVGSEVRCTEAMNRWKSTLDKDGKISNVRYTNYSSASSAIEYAIRQMEKAVEIETTYEVQLIKFPDNLKCGDIVAVLDAHDNILLEARALKWTRSESRGTASIELGDFVTLQSSKADLGIPQEVMDEISAAAEAVADMQERMDSGEFKGDPGEPGAPGTGAIVTQTATGAVITDGSGNSATITNGSDGEPGDTPYIQNGYWYINGISTGVKAEGDDGNTPYIQNGYWYINGTSTGIKAEGEDGDDGDDGTSVTSSTPFYRLATTTPSKPADNVMNPSGWYTTEPTYDANYNCYVTIRTVFDDGTCKWSDVSKSSSYEAAKQADEKADAASTLLAEMEAAAEAAGTTLKDIYAYAESAEKSAIEANENAKDAASNAYASQTSLSEIERVVDALSWISQHGVFDLTDDTTALPGKFYFTDNEGKYDEITPVCNPSIQGYYQLATQTWTLSSDTTVNEGKVYYIRSGSGTQADPYVYSPENNPTGNPHQNGYYELTSATYTLSSDTTAVAGKLYFTRRGSGTSGDPYIYSYVEPEADPHALGLYELTDIDASITNYIATHVALVDDALIIQTDGTGSKIRLSGNGIELRNDSNKTIATYSDDITLGEAEGAHIVLSPGDQESPPELAFWQGDVKVAYVNSDTLGIDQARIDNTLRIGQFLWKVQGENRVSLVYSPISEEE